ncbi:sensor histidine kinase [Adhaeribacter rhizoryzae]|uniref:histidine kinase n=1 Tax=Adhaeribacter rhizoryzae TaxID=2607907 RepID=A0A5M6DE55_9BACT|nr:PAS domain-containing sensor histidine kinase [Adhaeribacter rhizoryzae]KAA5543475.1 PAS domain S-box protein [Adhaeribacter rhizoryzae]
MLNANELGAVFAYADSPYLIVSAEAAYPIVAANAAASNWSHFDADKLIHESRVAGPAKFADLLGLPETRLVDLFGQVISTLQAIKIKVEPPRLPDNDLPVNECASVLEIFPLITNNQVTYLVLKVFLADKILPEPSASEIAHIHLPETQQSLAVIFDSLANVIFVLDVEAPDLYKFSYVNRAFQVTTGLPVSKVVGSYVQEIIPEPSLSLVLEKYHEAITKRKQVSWQEVSEYPAGQKTGEVLVEPVFDAQGNCLRLVGMVHDITERKEIEVNQMRLTQDLYQHNRDLEQFTYIVSHNLRAPLANALGLVRHLPNMPTTTELYQQYLSHLITSIEKLDTILKDVTQILSVRDRQNIDHYEAVVLAEVCEQAKQDLAPELGACGGHLHIAVAPDFIVHGSRVYLYSIFHNLISNAIKYRSLNRVLEINITTINTTPEEKTIQFSDNGLGFDMNKYENDVFKLYKRFHHNSSIEGRGVGLFLVKTHVEALGGNITVKSTLNAGTTFTINFKSRA